MGRWYDNLEHAGAPADRELIREVNHATGNLVHRMFYWAELLGDAPPPRDAQEAVEHLKTSLGELHKLVTRSLDLVRDVEVRAVGISVPDLVRGIAMRLGTAPDWSELPGLEDELGGRDATVDPLVVDRGVGLLAEALVHRVRREDEVATCEVSPLRVRRAPGAADSDERDGIFLHFAVRALDGHEKAKPNGHVEDAVALALARKLLTALGWMIEIDDTENERRLVLFVPISQMSNLTAALSLS